jgi:hypothetical protein
VYAADLSVPILDCFRNANRKENWLLILYTQCTYVDLIIIIILKLVIKESKKM